MFQLSGALQTVSRKLHEHGAAFSYFPVPVDRTPQRTYLVGPASIRVRTGLIMTSAARPSVKQTVVPAGRARLPFYRNLSRNCQVARGNEPLSGTKNSSDRHLFEVGADDERTGLVGCPVGARRDAEANRDRGEVL